MNNHALTHTKLQQPLTQLGQVVGRRLNTAELTCLNLVENEVVDIGQAGQDKGISVGILAHEVDRGDNPPLLCGLENFQTVACVHAVKQQKIAEMKHFRIEQGKRDVIKAKLCRCTGINEKGSFAAHNTHHIAETRRSFAA